MTSRVKKMSLNEKQKRMLQVFAEENKILNEARKILNDEYDCDLTIDELQNVITVLKRIKYL